MNYNRTIKGDRKDSTEGDDVCYKNTNKKELQTITKYNINCCFSIRSYTYILKVDDPRNRLARHRGNTFFDVTVTGQWSSPSGCAVLRSIDQFSQISILVRFKVENILDTSRYW